ncbi:MAG: fused MFS/spermidine synthase [Acidobacteria bacterium]|nr:fused MFS/spermidine synthase [Acidobacteriota bacterium]
MTDRKRPATRVPVASPPKWMPAVLLLSVGSGCAALIYEIVWFQLLELVLGATAASLAVVLGTFMGGMCLGSLLLPRLVPARLHPLRVYAAIELAIGALALLVLLGLPALITLYVTYAVPGAGGIGLRALLCSAILLPPTILMGATLPAVARWARAAPDAVSWLGFFYGGNIAGAVLGSVLAGFYLLRVHDVTTATMWAAALNAAVAVLALALAMRSSYAATAASDLAPPSAGTPWAAFAVIGLSGLGALGAEVVWTRVLSLLLGGTVYTFSMITAVFLLGLGIGSAAGAWMSRAAVRPGLALAGSQIGAAVGVAWGALLMNRAFPYWPIDPSLAAGPWYNFQIDLLRVMVAVLPAACCWGASFPLALATAARVRPPSAPGADPAQLVAHVYAANTVGAVLGALVFSLFVIPRFGTQEAERFIIWSSAAAAVTMLFSNRAGGAPLPALRRMAGAAAALAVAAAAAASVAPVPPELIAYGRQLATFKGARFLYTGEGLNSSIAVSEMDDGVRNFHVSGKVEASTEVHDMRLQRLLAHLSALMHPRPRRVLVVGFGAGVTAGSFLLYPDVERVVICEIEPLIPRMVASYFSNENYNVLDDPRVEVVSDDARHYILTTGETFDVITSDPIHPWVKGAASLYTREYFDLVKAHLNPGGVVTQWVPLYQSADAAVKSEVATFFDVFPFGTIWSNQYASGGGYDTVLLARPEPLRIDPAALQARLERPDHARVASALAQVELGGAAGLLATYAGQARDLRPWLADAEINRDRNLRLQYLAGLANNVYDARIYEDMLAYRRFPDEMLTGSPDLMEGLRQIMTQRRDAETSGQRPR